LVASVNVSVIVHGRGSLPHVIDEVTSMYGFPVPERAHRTVANVTTLPAIPDGIGISAKLHGRCSSSEVEPANRSVGVISTFASSSFTASYQYAELAASTDRSR
jgi:hypothetical protein